MAYHMDEFVNARSFLLQAVGCKSEQRHELIVEMLFALQLQYQICLLTASTARNIKYSFRNLTVLQLIENHYYRKPESYKKLTNYFGSLFF